MRSHRSLLRPGFAGLLGILLFFALPLVSHAVLLDPVDVETFRQFYGYAALPGPIWRVPAAIKMNTNRVFDNNLRFRIVGI